MDIDEEAHPKIRKPRSKWKCGLKALINNYRTFLRILCLIGVSVENKEDMVFKL